MKETLFNISDAHNAMENLTAEQALYWAKIANTEYARLSATTKNEVMTQRKAIRKACDVIKAKYGTH